MYTGRGVSLQGGTGMKQTYAKEANLVFLMSIIASKCLIYLVAGAGLRDSMALQFFVQVFIAFPAVAYLFLHRVPVKEELMLRSVGWKEWLLLLPFAVCINKVAEFINVLSQLFTENTVGSHMAELILKYPFPIAFLVIAVMPAICEELVFRGVLYRGYRKCGQWVAIIVTAVLFGFMHMNPNQLPYAVTLGILFATVNEITGSMLPSVLLHLYINGRSVVALYGAVNYLEGLRERYVAAEAVGDKALMEEVLSLAQEVPIASENWLEEYMTLDAGTVPEQLAVMLPQTLAAVAGTVLLLFVLLRCKGKKRSWRDVFRKEEEKGMPEDRGGFRAILSPALFIGLILCIAYMF